MKKLIPILIIPLIILFTGFAHATTLSYTIAEIDAFLALIEDWTDGSGQIDGEEIADDTVDDDSIDLGDITLNDFTFDVGSVSKTEYGTLNGIDASQSIQAQLDSGGGRIAQGLTMQTFTGSDATPDVSNNGSTLVQFWATVDATPITDLDDGTGAFSGDSTANHSGFSDGDSIVITCRSAQVFDLSDNANLKGHGNNDLICAAGEFIIAVFDDTNDYWVLKPSETKSTNFTDFKPPNATDPNVDVTAEISLDTDGANEALDASGRAFDGTNQYMRWRKLKCFQWTVIKPNDLANSTRDACPIWSNETGMTFTVTKVESWSDTDDTEYNLEEEDADGANNATITAVGVDTNGTGLFYDTVTSMTGTATVEANHIVLVDFDDTDTPGWVKGTVCGWFNANVD